MKKKTATKYRVRARSHSDGWGKTQLLQERRWWGWKTIDSEEVPREVIVSIGTIGDTGGWVSKFAALGSFGRDGNFRPASSGAPA